MPQLMPLFWVLSVLMVVLFYICMMLFFGNYLMVEDIKKSTFLNKKLIKWLW